jgi:WD40 repeat protein
MWHSDRATIVTGGQDGTVHLWEPDSGAEVCQLSLAAEVVATSRSPDGNQILTVVKSGAITVWQARDNKGQILCTKQNSNLPVVAKIPAFGEAAYALWSSDGQRIAVAYEDGTLRLFNVSFDDLLRQAQSLAQ